MQLDICEYQFQVNDSISEMKLQLFRDTVMGYSFDNRQSNFLAEINR